MNSKKETIDEKMSRCIFYNLSILKRAVKTTREFDENLSTTMFIKSNTKTFIYVTHFIFNIIDGKEFAKKFYWPISEKKAENSYRSSSIEFINSLIDKHSLAQEKVKLVFVVHPCGKKFMSLILDLISIATKEIMKSRNFPPEKSFDIEEVTQACANIKHVENDLVNRIKTETKLIVERKDAIRDLIEDKIYSRRMFPLSFEEFIASWHEHNKAQLAEINEQSKNMERIKQQTSELCMRADVMLSRKNIELDLPPIDVMRQLADFYEKSDKNIPPAIVDGSLNFPWLIVQLHLVMPSITAYVNNFSFEGSANNYEELKVLKRLSTELKKIESNLDQFSARFREKLSSMVAIPKKLKEEQQQIELENLSPGSMAERTEKEEIESESLKLLTSPRFYFDASKECLKTVNVMKNRLALMDDDDELKENFGKSLNFRRVAKSPYVDKTKFIQPAMGPPKQQPKGRDAAMAMLERATLFCGAKSQIDLNSSRYISGVGKLSQHKFSSTMLSSDLNQQLFNCSTMSEICGSSPITPYSPVPEFTVPLSTPKSSKSSFNDGSLSNPWNTSGTLNTTQRSPKGNLNSLVSVEEIFKKPPTFEPNDETEVKLCKEKSVTTSDSTSFSCTSIILHTDEDLFNVSDTLLHEISE